jgi:hypothetical protein
MGDSSHPGYYGLESLNEISDEEGRKKLKLVAVLIRSLVISTTDKLECLIIIITKMRRVSYGYI